MLSTLNYLIVLSILIVVHECGHFLLAKKAGVRVERFALGFGPKIFSWKVKGTEFMICLIPLGGYVKMAGDSLEECKGASDEYYAQPIYKRAGIIVFGPVFNYLIGVVCFILVFLVGMPRLDTSVGELLEGYGAQKAGVVAGDTITAVDGTKVVLWEELQAQIIRKKSNDSVVLSIDRSGTPLSVTVSLKENVQADQLGKKRKVSIIGIRPSGKTVTIKHGVAQSVLLGVKESWTLITLTYRALWGMVAGQLPIRESVTGVVGMYYISSEVIKLGIMPLLHLFGIFSISLCIFNLLPIPALDGFHLALLTVEKVRGKALSRHAETVINQIGLTALVGLALFVTYNDLFRFGIIDKVSKFFIKG